MCGMRYMYLTIGGGAIRKIVNILNDPYYTVYVPGETKYRKIPIPTIDKIGIVTVSAASSPVLLPFLILNDIREMEIKMMGWDSHMYGCKTPKTPKTFHDHVFS
jgi:hypothetical protein